MAKSSAETESDRKIMKMFRGRCIVCMSPATEIHEIVLRSRSKFAVSMPSNRVPLCRHHHNGQHLDGVTVEKQEFLRGKAIERLIMFGESLEDW